MAGAGLEGISICLSPTINCTPKHASFYFLYSWWTTEVGIRYNLACFRKQLPLWTATYLPTGSYLAYWPCDLWVALAKPHHTTLMPVSHEPVRKWNEKYGFLSEHLSISASRTRPQMGTTKDGIISHLQPIYDNGLSDCPSSKHRSEGLEKETLPMACLKCLCHVFVCDYYCCWMVCLCTSKAEDPQTTKRTVINTTNV